MTSPSATSSTGSCAGVQSRCTGPGTGCRVTSGGGARAGLPDPARRRQVALDQVGAHLGEVAVHRLAGPLLLQRGLLGAAAVALLVRELVLELRAAGVE